MIFNGCPWVVEIEPGAQRNALLLAAPGGEAAPCATQRPPHRSEVVFHNFHAAALKEPERGGPEAVAVLEEAGHATDTVDPLDEFTENPMKMAVFKLPELQ